MRLLAGEMEWGMTGGVEAGDCWVEIMDDDCEYNEGEGVMSGDGSGGAEGEESCESDVWEGKVGGFRERWVSMRIGRDDTCVVVVASVSSSGECASVGREESCW